MANNESKRIFLGWQQPLLTSTVDWIWQTYRPDATWDLSNLTIVLTGRRAVRQFKAMLRERATQNGIAIVEPKVLTIGTLPELLYEPTFPLASELEQTLAWCSVLRAQRPTTLTPLIAAPPPLFPVTPWLELAGAVRRLHEELASEHYSFGDVAEHLNQDSPQEASRWQLLHNLTEVYVQTLNNAKRSDPYVQRRQAADNGVCKVVGDVIVVGAVDLNKSIRSMLHSIHAQVTILVGAPESETDAFDADGCVIPQRWLDRTIEIDDDRLIPASDAEDLAIVAQQQVSQWRSNYSMDEITIGITDEAMIAPLAEQLEMSDIEVHAEIGEPLLRSAPARLVALIVDYQQNRSYSSLSALVRHADLYHCIEAWLNEPAGESSLDKTAASSKSSTLSKQNDKQWLICLDRLRSEHLPLRVDDPLPIDAPDRETVRRTVEVIDRWLEPLMKSVVDDPQSSDSAVHLSEWSASVREVLNGVYDHVLDSLSEDRQKRLNAARTTIDAVIAGLSQVPPNLQLSLPGSTIAEMFVAQLAEVRIHESGSNEKLEIVGWLDLSLDVSPALCVVGLNDPFVPESVVADPFLPGGLRRRLKIADNDQRFARDAYALSAILHSRADVRILVGRSSADGSPTPPSRLLAACSPQTAAERIMRLLAELPPRSVPENIWTQGRSATELPLPVPSNYRPPSILSVTAFGDYLRCPYRFYLRHIAKLHPLDDQAIEMAANQFGNLVHDSLEQFGKEGPNHSTNVRTVGDYLLDAASDLAKRRFGERPSAPVRLQITGAMQRLEIVAEKHVQRTKEGWLLWAAERSVEDEDNAVIMVDDEPFGLRGRIDRIDFNEQTNQWAVIDYKTHAHHPMKKHYKKSTDEWIDLQLPLYRHMLSALKIEGDLESVQLGYFNIGERESDIKVNIAEFTAEHYASADRTASNVVRGIRNGDFVPNPSAATDYDDYAAICQTGVIGHRFVDVDIESLEETLS